MSSFRRRQARRSDATAVVETVRAIESELLRTSEYDLAELESEWLALDPADLSAFHDAGWVGRTERLGVGWVARVFTRRPWRGRGLGAALLADAFATYWERGQPAIGLGVDAQSATGAQRLYERAGMHVRWAAVVFEKELA